MNIIMNMFCHIISEASFQFVVNLSRIDFYISLVVAVQSTRVLKIENQNRDGGLQTLSWGMIGSWWLGSDEISSP